MLWVRRHLRRGGARRVDEDGPRSSARLSAERRGRRGVDGCLVSHASRWAGPARRRHAAGAARGGRTGIRYDAQMPRRAFDLPVLDQPPSRPVDHATAAAEFTADEARTDWHDGALWFVREKRDLAAASVPEWETLRDLASAIKEHTLSHLDEYLEQF